MKLRIPKVLGSLLLITLVALNSSLSVFAAGDISDSMTISENLSSDDSEIVPAAVGQYDSGDIPYQGELTLYPTLNSYVGLQRTFWFTTNNVYSDKVPSGNIRVYVSKPDGKLLDYFTVTAKDFYQKTYTLPSSGKYTVKIYSDVKEKIHASAGWSLDEE